MLWRFEVSHLLLNEMAGAGAYDDMEKLNDLSEEFRDTKGWEVRCYSLHLLSLVLNHLSLWFHI